MNMVHPSINNCYKQVNDSIQYMHVYVFLMNMVHRSINNCYKQLHDYIRYMHVYVFQIIIQLMVLNINHCRNATRAQLTHGITLSYRAYHSSSHLSLLSTKRAGCCLIFLSNRGVLKCMYNFTQQNMKLLLPYTLDSIIQPPKKHFHAFLQGVMVLLNQQYKVI